MICAVKKRVPSGSAWRRLFAYERVLGALHGANARRAGVGHRADGHQHGDAVLALPLGRVQPGSEHESGHGQLGDEFSGRHRQRHDQIHHPQSTGGKPILPAEIALIPRPSGRGETLSATKQSVPSVSISNSECVLIWPTNSQSMTDNGTIHYILVNRPARTVAAAPGYPHS
jgi:hypothetical protein